MTERKGQITFQGNPLTLEGQELKTDQPAPDCTLLNTELKEVQISDFLGKIVILSVVPSLDTSVCSAQTHRFNEETTRMSGDTVVLAVSMDLPFAQKRWCGAEGVDRVITLSDHRKAEFGRAYGVLIQELRLLARAVFIIDRNGTIAYIQQVGEITNEPDYDAVLKAVAALK